jgi:hypothetical protein
LNVIERNLNIQQARRGQFNITLTNHDGRDVKWSVGNIIQTIWEKARAYEIIGINRCRQAHNPLCGKEHVEPRKTFFSAFRLSIFGR